MFREIDLQNDSTRELFNKIIDNEKDINSLLNSINTSINDITSQLSNANESITTLNAEFSTADKNITDILKDLSDLQTNVNSISDSLSSASDKIENIVTYTTSNNITMSQLLSLGKYQLNSHIYTSGYYSINDGGAAEYLISSDKYSWSVKLTDLAGNIFYANIINKDFINYKMFGAKLDGAIDDTSSLQKTHNYANAYNIPIKNNSGIIYKPNSTPISITSNNIDLSGSTIKITSELSGPIYTIKDSNIHFTGGIVSITSFPVNSFNIISAVNSKVILDNLKISNFDNSNDTNSYDFSLIKLNSCDNSEIKNIKSLGSTVKLKENISCNTIEIINSKNISINNCSIPGYSESVSISETKAIDIFNSTFNILNLSHGNSLINIEKCTFENNGIILGYGKYFLKVKDSKFIKINNSSPNIINFDFSQEKIFDGRIILENINVLKENSDINLFNLAYTVSDSIKITDNIKIPSIYLKDIKINNKEAGTSKFIIFNLSGNSNYSASTSKIKKPDDIIIDNISYSNPDNTIGNIFLLLDASTKDMYSVDNSSYIKILNTVFSLDPVPATISSTSSSTITIEDAIGDTLSINTSSILFNNTKLILDNVKTNLKNSNKNTSLYINNSNLYAFSQDAIIPAFINTIINNSILRVFNCSITDNKCTVPIGAYNTCFFSTYKYTKSADTTIYTCTISKSAEAKVLNSNI